MFAGPNGSGKSTLKYIISPDLLGVYINPDDIERVTQLGDGLDLFPYRIVASTEEVQEFFRGSTLLSKVGRLSLADCVGVIDNRLVIDGSLVDAYFASIISDFIRQKLLVRGVSFTLETVMSSPDKVHLLEKAQSMGYRTYLYYVATEDPSINISRVQSRVRLGGHQVPEDKIVTRYARSLSLLWDAIRFSNRAYIFDNSIEGEQQTWIAEITDGSDLELKTDLSPNWFDEAVIRRIL